jgi:hypothetical protein
MNKVVSAVAGVPAGASVAAPPVVSALAYSANPQGEM